MSTTNGKKQKARRFHGHDQEGFAIVIVLVALLMLSVLGAASLLLVVSSLQGMVNMKPEEKAFQVAESGLYVAHSKIVNNAVPGASTTIEDSGSILGGNYDITIDRVPGSTTHYKITSSGKYVQDGTAYRRKLQEQVYYSGDQAYDAMRNYILFAGRDLNMNYNELINFNLPTRINGNIRAEEAVNISFTPTYSDGPGLTINGSIEGKDSVRVVAEPSLGDVVVNLFGDIKSGDANDPTSQGLVYLEAGSVRTLLSNDYSYIYAATTGVTNYDLMYTSLTTRTIRSGDRVYTGNQLTTRGVEEVYTPRPDFAFFKELAKKQGKFQEGDLVLNGNLGSYGTSEETVVYCTGNMTVNSLTYDKADMKGIFVCEGNFSASNSSSLFFKAGSRFQVIAGGDISFQNRWSFDSIGSAPSNEYFFWAGNDVVMHTSMFAGEKLQATAMRDINISTSTWDLFNLTEINYKAPDINISGFPIDVTVTNFTELPAD